MSSFYKAFLFFLIAVQPLHSYTYIDIKTPEDSNGFHLLHAELCGSKYSNSISHTEKISELLDKINQAVLSEMKTDCVCCESIDTSSIDTIVMHPYYLEFSNSEYITNSLYYFQVSENFSNQNSVRAPPVI
tara:strand:- start:372 stop:764 length:393 start_codon:yes stop_codon:yes gene_type:complete